MLRRGGRVPRVCSKAKDTTGQQGHQCLDEYIRNEQKGKSIYSYNVIPCIIVASKEQY